MSCMEEKIVKGWKVYSCISTRGTDTARISVMLHPSHSVSRIVVKHRHAREW